MTEREIELISVRNDKIDPEDSIRIIKEVANVKRLLDIYSLIPGSLEKYKENKEKFLEDNRIMLCVEDADFLINPEDPYEKQRIINENDLKNMPESFFRYRQFLLNKLTYRNKMINELCVPSNEKMKKWRERQIRRCDSALGGLNESFVHSIVTYEMASGCSVGCKFCGLNAGPLRKLFRFTPENEKLFRDVLKKSHEILGDAAGHGTMYFATEPLDNPDYEQFEKLHYEEFHIVPQITTAACDRNFDRTRSFVRELMEGKGFIHRFTILNEEMAEKVFDFFTPEELIYVELLPQFEDAPGFRPYVKVGREVEDENETPIVDDDPGTICCIDGFCINFPDRRFKLISPCRVSEENPKGIFESEWVEFDSADDYADKLKKMIDEYMSDGVPKSETLKMYEYFSMSEVNDIKVLTSKYKKLYYLKDDYMVKVAKLIFEGKYTRDEIVRLVMCENEVSAENVYWFINKLWNNGCIKETKMF